MTHRLGRDRGLWLGLFLAALPLRFQIVVVAPLIPLIQADLGSSHATLGILTTIPVLCMGLFAVVGGQLSLRLGPRRGVTVCLLALGTVALLRAMAPDVGTLIALTVPVGIAVGAGGVLLPLVVKANFSERPGMPTGLYTGGMQLGAAIAAAVAVPIAAALGSWRVSLALTAIATLPLAGAWASLAGFDRPAVTQRTRLELTTRPIVWVLAVAFGIQGLGYFGVSAWLPAVYVERGWTGADAGLLLTAFNATALITSLVTAALSDHIGSRRVYLLVGSLALSAAAIGLIVAPAGAYLWAIVAGAALSVLFVITLILPLDVANDGHDAAAITATVLGVGYTIAASAPFALGLARDLTGSFVGSLWILVAIGALSAVAASWISPSRLCHPEAQPVKGCIADYS